jgi:predicted AAA+ superfamily ATPase
MIISSVKEAEAKQQKELEDIIRIKDEEIERLTHICDILKNTNDILGKQF